MREVIEQFSIWSMLDISIAAVIIYQVLLLLRGTRAAQMLTGILLIVLLYVVSSILPLTTLHWMMNKFYSSFIILLIIVFQDDIRYVLSSMGRKPLIQSTETAPTNAMLDEVARAANTLASKRIGALIILERSIKLTRYVEAGIRLEARVSKEILVSIFHPSSPIHDGAVIIQKNRLSAAGCFLPLTRDESVDPNFGTRHRAAIGISQVSDAVVVLISEEGASAAVVVDGKVYRKTDARSLKDHLMELMPQAASERTGDIPPLVKAWQRLTRGE
jgi:diadenylate cyclase